MNALRLGWLFSLLLSAALPAETTAVYQVVKGDCLWKIAARLEIFGDAWQWPLISRANPVLIQDPDRIEPGWRLEVPLMPSEAQVDQARLEARRYKESSPAPALAAVPPARAEAPPAGAQAEPEGRPWLRLGLFLLFAALAALAAVIYGLLKRREDAAMPSAVPKRPELTVLSSAEPERGEGLPTESEANLRADVGPDPLHPEHREAA